MKQLFIVVLYFFIANGSLAAPVDKETMKKAKQCQKQGGVWIDNVCQISLDDDVNAEEQQEDDSEEIISTDYMKPGYRNKDQSKGSNGQVAWGITILSAGLGYGVDSIFAADQLDCQYSMSTDDEKSCEQDRTNIRRNGLISMLFGVGVGIPLISNGASVGKKKSVNVHYRPKTLTANPSTVVKYTLEL